MKKPKAKKIKQKVKRQTKLVPLQVGDDAFKIIGWLEVDIEYITKDKVIEVIFSGKKIIGFKLVDKFEWVLSEEDKNKKDDDEDLLEKLKKSLDDKGIKDSPFIPTPTQPIPIPTTPSPYIGDPPNSKPIITWSSSGVDIPKEKKLEVDNAVSAFKSARTQYLNGLITDKTMKKEITNYMDIMSDYIDDDVKKTEG